MMFKPYISGEDLLIPLNLMDLLGEHHTAITLSKLIDKIDLSKLVNRYTQYGRGRPRYHPVCLFKVLVYAYMNQTFSSRRIAFACVSDVGFIYLSGMQKADFRTISLFRKQQQSLLQELFVEIVLLAKQAGLISLKTVNIDGTKIYANSAKHKRAVKKIVRPFFEECEAVDKTEDEEYGDHDGFSPPDGGASWEEREKRIDAAIAMMNEQKENDDTDSDNDSDEPPTPPTPTDDSEHSEGGADGDARLMLMKRKDFAMGYNVQNVTENQFICEVRVSNAREDTSELIPTISSLMNRYGVTPNVVADKGYASEANYRFLKTMNSLSYIPHQKLAVRLEDYHYDPETDTYTSQTGAVYTRKQVFYQPGGKRGRPQADTPHREIKSIIYHTQLANGKHKYLSISPYWQQLCAENDERLYSPEGQITYKKRSGCVETVFGNIKHNLGFNRFRLRGFSGATIERLLISIAHNCKKLLPHLPLLG